MKKLFVILLVLLCSSVLFGKEIIQEPKERCTPETFRIYPWGINMISQGSLGDIDSYYEECYDCGFNEAGFLTEQFVSKAKDHNIKVSLYANNYIDSSIKDEKARAKDWAEKLNKIIKPEDRDSIVQIYIQDEPTSDDIPRVSAFSKACQEIVGKSPYINYFPTSSEDEHFGNLTREEYYDQMADACNLDSLSYDCYALYEDGGFNEFRFYENIELMRKTAIKHKLPWTNIILSVGHFNYSLPDDYSINVQAWSTLAYGANGLSYFTFLTPLSGNYRGGAYDKFGNRTPLWYVIRNMNFCIHNLMPYYKNLSSVNVFHIGNVPKGCNDIKSAKVIKSINPLVKKLNDSRIKNQKKIKANIVVGEFVGKDGKEYAIIVNKDPKYSVIIDSISFNKGNKVKHIKDMSINQPEADFVGEDRWIAPGHGILLRAD